MAQSTTNVIVGAANVAIGSYSSDYSATGDTLWNALKSTVGAGKDFRGWVRGLTTGTTVSVAGGFQGAGITAAAGSAVFTDVGLTQEGVEVQYQPDFGEVEVDQLLDAARLFKQRMTVSVATTFAEATLDNLLTVWAQSPGTKAAETTTLTGSTGVRLSGGELGEAPIEKALLFVGNAPGTPTTYRQRVYLANRALSVEASSHSLRRSEATVFPVTFRLLPDTAASYSAYGRVVDVV
jgi:hypothetical protein